MRGLDIIGAPIPGGPTAAAPKKKNVLLGVLFFGAIAASIVGVIYWRIRWAKRLTKGHL